MENLEFDDHSLDSIMNDEQDHDYEVESVIEKYADDIAEVTEPEGSDWKIFSLSLAAADDVCMKLDKLIQTGIIPKDKIMYKYLKDTVAVLIKYEVICKVAAAVGVQIAQDNIEISHRLYRKKGTKPIIAKFLNHKDKTKLYKARVQLRNVTLSTLFPSCSATSLAGQEIFINENLTRYRNDMMKFANEKCKDGNIPSAWSLDGKIFIKTSPSACPRQMFSIEDIKEL